MEWLRERKRVRYGEEVDLNGDMASWRVYMCVYVYLVGGYFPIDLIKGF